MKKTFLFLILFCSYQFTLGQQPQSLSASSIQLELNKLNTVGTVMYIAAHPDDENTRLLSYLANERLFRTVYLSLTRGDGGQNLIGSQQSEELGLIRTQELLAARRTDGAEQYFTSAVDFGYSKNPEETFEKWDKQRVIREVVWAIRKFQPDVIITRFPSTGEGGHGHHTASAIAAFEAFKAAADPKKYPEQLKYYPVWQAKRIFFNSFNRRGMTEADQAGNIRLDVGGYNALLGKSYGEIAAASRSMHKSQGFGAANTRGVQYEYFKRIDGDTAVQEILGGINPFWMRFEKTDSIQKWLSETIDYFNPSHPEYTVYPLTLLYRAMDTFDDSLLISRKHQDIRKLIAGCMGLYLEAGSPSPELVPGADYTFSINVNSRTYDKARLVSIKIGDADTSCNVQLKRNETFTWEKNIRLSETTPYSIPYWLNGPAVDNHYPGDMLLSGMPENPERLSATVTLEIEGQLFKFETPVTYKQTDPVKGEVYQYAAVVPPLSIKPGEYTLLFADATSKDIRVDIRAFKDEMKGKLYARLPAGWTSTPEMVEFNLNAGKSTVTAFRLTPPQKSKSDKPVKAKVLFEAIAGEVSCSSEVRFIDFDHIPRQMHLRPAATDLLQLPLETVATKIGYLEGAGDAVASCLQSAGFDVTTLTPALIKEDQLSQFDAVVTGIRAYNTIENIDELQPHLLDYVKNGGTLVMQYNTSNFVSSVKTELGPYPFTITRDRVTREEAKVNFVSKKSPVLNYPNQITSQDFEGWVQERGLYFAGEIDKHYETIFTMNDPDSPPLDGSLIVCKYGKGWFVYTGISFFRQLPAGVPGAYRLMTNLLNIGKNGK